MQSVDAGMGRDMGRRLPPAWASRKHRRQCPFRSNVYMGEPQGYATLLLPCHCVLCPSQLFLETPKKGLAKCLKMGYSEHDV